MGILLTVNFNKIQIPSFLVSPKRQGLQENDFIIDEIKIMFRIKQISLMSPSYGKAHLKNPNDPKIMSDETVKNRRKILRKYAKSTSAIWMGI